MSKQNRIQRLPVEVDPFRLVEQGRIYEGRIPLGDYPRLKKLLFVDDEGAAKADTLVNVILEFTKTDTRLPIILGKISTSFEVPCQRCLKAEEVSFETELNTVLVSTDEQAERLQEGYDTWLVEDQQLFLKDFIEDEILLAMPNIVMHEACDSIKELIEALPEDNQGNEDGLEEDEIDKEAKERSNPFAILKDLKID